MAPSISRKNAPLIEQLEREPGRFDFFQAVRLLQEFLRDDSQRKWTPVGYDGRPETEVVRFHAHQSHVFPSAAISQLTVGEEDVAQVEPLAQMTVTFLGLTGSSGVLPHHYTSLIIDRTRERDDSLRQFLDLFNHRLVSLFFRAWEKYRYPYAFERRKRAKSRETDVFTEALFSLVGLGTSRLRGRLEIDDEAFLFYAGHFARSIPNAVSLEAILSDYFELPVCVQSFHGQWLYLAPDQQSRVPSRDCPDGLNCAVGQNLIVGERVWSIETMFRVRLGPMNFEEFQRFLPGSNGLDRMCQLIRTYVGPEYDFDVQLVLRAGDVPSLQFSESESNGSRLGWNTWLFSGPASHDVDDAVFRNDGFPKN